MAVIGSQLELHFSSKVLSDSGIDISRCFNNNEKNKVNSTRNEESNSSSSSGVAASQQKERKQEKLNGEEYDQKIEGRVSDLIL